MIINNRILIKLKNKDEDTFKKIYDEYEKLIYFIALQITKNKETAEEVVQDTFLKMLNSIDSYTENGKFKEWLMTICRNISYNRITRDKEKDTLKDDSITDNVSAKSNDQDILLTINGILDELSASVVIYRIYYDLSFKEIANYYEMSLGTIQGIYYKAIKTLRKEFKYES